MIPSAVGVLLSLAAQADLAAETATGAAALRVVMFPSYAKPVTDGPSILEGRRLRAFTRALQTAARERFRWRRFRVAAESDVEAEIAKFGGPGQCLDARCYDGVTDRLGGSHWLAALVVEREAGVCLATVVLEDRRNRARAHRVEREVSPCTTDNLVAAGRGIGRAVADGPRAPVRVTLDLTDLSPPSVGIPDVPEVELLATSTAVLQRGELSLDEALSVYKRRYLYAFDQELRDGTRTLVARDQRLIGECAIRRAAGAPIDDEIEEFCDGNNWEWAWLGVPVGAVVSFGSFRGLRSGSAPGVLGFVFGTMTGIISGALALILNEDAADPEEGEYWSHPRDLEAMVETANARLRETLRVTAAEVEAAGMRR